MTRISTAGSYQSALLNLMAAQSREADAQSRVSTQKVATDMAGFGRASEGLTAFKAAQARLQGFVSTGEAVGARLEAQDLALNQVNDSVIAARDAVANAIAANSVVTLMLDMRNEFQTIQSGLNATHQGNYLFGGANTDNAPVTVSTLAQLTAAPTVASVFVNDDLAPTSRLSEAGPIRTGFLADGVGTEVFQIFRDIQAYNDDPATGPFSGKPTDAQAAFLTTQLARLSAASVGVVNVIADNGALAKQVENRTLANTAQAESIEGLIGDRTDADMSQAITDLQLAQVAVQASAQVVSRLSQVSLLDYLR